MAFVATMLAAFAVASLGLPMPLVEPAISSSVVILGLFVALTVKAPVWLGAAIVGLFAFFHGHAHGTEVTATSLVSYAAGFALATTALHAMGIGLGLVFKRSISRFAIGAVGGFAVLSGLAFIVG